MQLETVQNRYLDGRREMNCSDSTASKVDKEVMKLLDECYLEAKKIISEHLDAIDKLAQFLIEKETISGKEFMKIYRESENIPEPKETEQKAPIRIFATRPESALVGENIPIKNADKKDSGMDTAKEQGGSVDAAEKESENSGEAKTQTWQTFIPPYPETVEAPVKQEAAETEVKAENENSDKKEQASVNGSEELISGGNGRFSHIPDDFQEKK